MTSATSPTSTSDRTAVAVLCSLLAVPWSVQVFTARDATFVFAWGLVNTNPPRVVSLFDFLLRYTMGLPEFILAWPVSVLLYALAVVSAVVGWRVGREDVRVTAGLLVFAGVAQLSLARGFSVQPGRVAYPVGTALLWAVAYWGYWPSIRRRRRG